MRVAKPPSKPLMVYDGDCNFCKFWIARWQQTTAERVDYMPSQDPRVGEQFPELARERFEVSVQFIETDGSVYDGAEAVFRSLACNPGRRWLLWLYGEVPGVAPVTEFTYRFVASHRTGFSTLTRVFWGRETAPPDYRLTQWVFLRFVGIIYLVAFLSLGSQLMGLAGSRGIMPAGQFMDSARQYLDQQQVGIARYQMAPTLCWFNASDGFLKMLWVAGAILSVLVIANVAPAPCLFLLWLIYLSLATVCREFLGFQWDNLLLETGWLAIFFAPLRLFPRLRDAAPPSRIVRWLLLWLLFRLMFESGAVKVASEDVTWRNLTALTLHYETQPLPTWIGWYAHQLPVGVQKMSAVLMFAFELVVPFLIFAPGRVRLFAFWPLLLLQAAIAITGNYCFFNLLTIALCFLLLGDGAMKKLIPKRIRFWKRKDPEILISVAPQAPVVRRGNWPVWVTAPLAIVILLVTSIQILGTLRLNHLAPRPLVIFYSWVAPFRSINGYGLFAVMTTRRPEIIIEGSNDGRTWREYEFKYKPGDLKRAPGFVAPHQPRLDWQMWFAALGDYRQNPWLVQFSARLLEGSPEVLALLDKNPFPDAPPRHVRAVLYEYNFTNLRERREQGVWWRRELKGEYMPVLSRPEAAEGGPNR